MLTMAPYVPFIVESFYQNMRMCIKPESQYYETSIHFLQIPHPKESLIDNKLLPIIEKMQKVIERVRKIRDLKNLPVKRPLEELLIVCKDEDSIAGLKVVEYFIKTECNVAKVSYSADWKPYIKYKLMPNNEVLGERFGSAFGPLRKKLMSVTDAQVMGFMETGKIVVDDIEFDETLMTPRAEFTPIKDKTKAIDGSLDFAVILDLRINEELRFKGLQREFTTRVQQLRKKAKLVLTVSSLVRLKILG
jgi:isoleucyl-tRNA synthetase